MSYRSVEETAYAAKHHAGELWDRIYQACDRCGAVVIDTEQHDRWHHEIERRMGVS